MLPFAAFWEKQKRKEDAGAVETARALLKKLAVGPARDLQVNLEDLWGERRPHNRPGTTGGGNWRRKAKFPLERFSQIGEITRPLEEIDRICEGRNS